MIEARRITMASKRTASRRALTVLRLLGKAPGWRVEHAFFSSSSRATLGGLPWRVGRAIHVRDFGMGSKISLTLKAPLTAKRRQHLASKVWPRLRKAIDAAGFETNDDLADGEGHWLFFRPLESVAEVRSEWRFLNALKSARGRSLPSAA
jgi:hypothetical protein